MSAAPMGDESAPHPARDRSGLRRLLPALATTALYLAQVRQRSGTPASQAQARPAAPAQAGAPAAATRPNLAPQPAPRPVAARSAATRSPARAAKQVGPPAGCRAARNNPPQ